MLEAKLYGVKQPLTAQRPLPDWNLVHAERLKPNATLELLHLEYVQQHRDGYRYTAFCEHYRRWLKTKQLSMRQDHRAGDKAFVDYSGRKPSYVDPATAQRIECELFVAVLGASNFTYAEPSPSQRGAHFIQSHVRALEYFDGSPSALVPDQLKSGVTKSCWYEPVHPPADDVVGADDPSRERRLAWAVLLKRAYAVDVLTCARCQGPMRLVSVVQDERVARRILEHLGLPARAPPRGRPSRAAVQERLSLDDPDRFDGIDATYPS